MKYDFDFDFAGEKLYSGIGESLDEIIRLCPDPSVIFDIGSYDGGDAVRFKKAFPGAQVYAIEASKERFEQVARICRPLGIVCFRAAIGKNGHAKFSMRYISDDSPG